MADAAILLSDFAGDASLLIDLRMRIAPYNKASSSKNLSPSQTIDREEITLATSTAADAAVASSISIT